MGNAEMGNTHTKPSPSSSEDLGIGRNQAESATRFLNKDGTFNVRRVGIGRFASLNVFYALITLPWWAFFGLLSAAFLVLNAVFAFLYVLCGPNALSMSTPDPITNPALRAFFFSIETLSTIGYGHIAPNTVAAHVLSSIEAFVGLLVSAIITGLVFARFSKPASRILWSEHAIVAPYKNGTGLMLRFVNGQRNDIIELSAQINFARFETRNGQRSRQFYTLELERERIAYFGTSWTLVHPITPKSPLWGVGEDDFFASQAEIMVVVRGMDDILYQPVHARASYKDKEIVWGAKFKPVTVPNVRHSTIDVRKLSDLERVALPEQTPSI